MVRLFYNIVTIMAIFTILFKILLWFIATIFSKIGSLVNIIVTNLFTKLSNTFISRRTPGCWWGEDSRRYGCLFAWFIGKDGKIPNMKWKYVKDKDGVIWSSPHIIYKYVSVLSMKHCAKVFNSFVMSCPVQLIRCTLTMTIRH